MNRKACGFFLLAFLAGALAPAMAEPDGAAQARQQQFRRGINLSHWFAQVVAPEGYTAAHFQQHTTARDAALIRAAGFDHVRLSVNPIPLFDPRRPERLPAEYLGHLDAALDMLLEHDLRVIVDIHPPDDFKHKLSEDAHVEAFAAFWQALAAHLSRRDPERLLLEVLNEPVLADRFRWMGIQAKVVAAMRQGAPRHTFVATGHRWSDLDQLVQMELLADPNVIYSFHFYAAHLFTHQGATWGSPGWRHLRRVPYPSSPEAVRSLVEELPDASLRLELLRYGYARWDRERIAAEIGQVAAWARRHGVPLLCTEFGVHRAFSDPAQRAAWIRDVRSELERHGIGWTMWDYAGDFSVVTREGGTPVLDENTATALGLQGR